jgi:hypothetical protein
MKKYVTTWNLLHSCKGLYVVNSKDRACYVAKEMGDFATTINILINKDTNQVDVI